ncbi:MAG TPA: polysaccharide deacetylase family protein [Candidatus Deferrimicrobiaceae bacterium]|nr:polysaccharide deacetylase family protein [Candidatus Deferrimicrobiaceae bacterium]
MSPVPVFMYHHVNPHKGDPVTVTPDVFEGQMRFLREGGYRSISPSDLLAYLQGGAVPKKSVAVTFDDGWLDNYLFAFPVLKKYGVRATVFLVTDRVDKASSERGERGPSVPTHRESKWLVREGKAHRVVLNWDHVREMASGGLVEFHSHTKTHPRCDTLSPEALAGELRGSREVIEQNTGRPCRYLCWPYGRTSPAAVEAAKRAGYHAAFTTKPGVVEAGGDPFDIRRIVVKDDVGWFERRTAVYTSSTLSKLYLMVKKA